MTTFWRCLLAVVGLLSTALQADELVIISPHRKSIQREVIPLFKEHYQKTYQKSVEVHWLDQGGTADDIRFIKSRFEQNPKTSGIDIFWGGGLSAFLELESIKAFTPYALKKDLADRLPKELDGLPLRSPGELWYAQAMSSFGIFYNKVIIQNEGFKEPKTWEDIAHVSYFGEISITDPRRSGSAGVMNNVILQAYGFSDGMTLLLKLAGNARSFTHSSSDPIKAVISGDVVASLAIDFYALSKINDLGPKNLGFVMPYKKTVLDPDPVAILRGAPHLEVAKRFVDFSLSKEAQALWMLPPGAVGGPKTAFLGRIAVNPDAYELTEGRRVQAANPFTAGGFFQFDGQKAAKINIVLSDFIGATMVDHHKALKKAYQLVKDQPDHQRFYQVNETEASLLALVAQWRDPLFRNRKLKEWSDMASQKYQKIIEDHKSEG